MSDPALIYKIESVTTWSEALARGRYIGSADDVRDGFIHFSTADQARATAAKYFAGQHNLVIAAVRTDALATTLRWEAARGGALFPHLYAALDMVHVVWTKPLPLASGGGHAFPTEMV